MTEQGVVLSVKDKFAKVRVGRNSACGSCGKCGMTEKQKHVDFFASNEVGAVVGDTVSLDIPETNTVKLVLVAYFLPLIPALAMLFLSIGLKWADWLSAILFFAGLVVGFAILFVIDRARKSKWMETPTIIAVVSVSKSDQTQTKQGEENHE